jgi:hypothetical protein
MTMSSPRLYKGDVLKAIATIDRVKVNQAIAILGQARDDVRRIAVCGNNVKDTEKPTLAEVCAQ